MRGFIIAFVLVAIAFWLGFEAYQYITFNPHGHH